MSDFSKTFSVGEGISFGDDVVGIVFGTTNPSIAGEIAPTGTLFLRTDGTLFQKIGSPDTDWTLIASAASDQLVRVTTSDTTSDFLDSKLVIGSPTTIALTVKNPGGNETLTIDLNAALDDLTDVVISPPTSNNTIKFSTEGSPPVNKWINVAGVSAPPPGSFGVVQLFLGPITKVSGTTKIAKDNTTPLITEGTEIWSQTITPTLVGSPRNTIRVRTNFTFSSSNASLELVVAIFRDTTCIGVAISATSNNNTGFAISTSFYDRDATPDVEHTYSCRVGRTGNNGTWFINQISNFLDAFPVGSPATTLLTELNAFLVEEIGENV